MKKMMIAAVALLLMSGAAFAQDEGKKDIKVAHKEMKQEARTMKKDAKKAGNDVKAEATRDKKHGHKSTKKETKKIDN